MNESLLGTEKPLSIRKYIKSMPYSVLFIIIMSIVAVFFGFHDIYSNNTLHRTSTAQFHIASTDGDIIPGMVVSLNEEGRLVKQCGTTVYKNQHTFKYSMLNANVITLSEDCYVIVCHGKMTAVKLNYYDEVLLEKEVPLPLILIGKQREIDAAVLVPNSNQILIIGSSDVIPVIVNYSEKQFSFSFGKEVPYYHVVSPLNPKVSMDNNNRLAILYSDYDTTLQLATFTADPSTNSIQLTSSEIIGANSTVYAVTYIHQSLLLISYVENHEAGDTTIHIVVGKEVMIDSTHFTVSLFNSTHIYCSHGILFLSMDSWIHFNKDNKDLIISYLSEDDQDGLTTRHLRLMTNEIEIKLGSRLMNRSGSGIGVDTRGIHHFALLMLQKYKMMIYYSSVLNGGYTAMQIGYLTRSLELIKEGPQYVLSQGIEDTNEEYYSVSASASQHRVILLESLYRSSTIETEMSYMDIYNLPVGIVISAKNDTATIVTNGLFTLPASYYHLTPGKYYYSNSKGQYVEGEWVGMRGVSGYFVFIENDKAKMLTDVRSRIGYSIGDKSFMVQFT